MIDLISSIEKELKSLTGEETLVTSLKKLELLKDDSPQIVDIMDWERTGGETYCMYFSLQDESLEEKKRLVLKACISSPLVGIDNVLNSWIERRSILQENSVSTPKLYAYGKGVLLEEFIPYTIQEVMYNSPQMQDLIIQKLYDTYKAIGDAGFKPNSLLHNFRSRGNDIVNIDFGSDLGAASNNKTDLTGLFDKELKSLCSSLVLYQTVQDISENKYNKIL